MNEEPPPAEENDQPTSAEEPTLDPSCRASTAAEATVDASGAPSRSRSAFQLTPGQQFGPYRILRPLGKGGMGEVYEAEHLETHHRLALKIIAAGTLGSEEQRKRFLREGLLAASINHPHSLYVYGTAEIDGTPIISMEFVSGGTLRERVEADGPMLVVDAVDAIRQVIEGLATAHALGILHRDVKPANCFVDRYGGVKVGDYGLSVSTSVLEETQLTAAGAVLGTPAFASPEQLRGEALDVRTDIFSVGATLYYLLTGHVPFEAQGAVQTIAAVLSAEPTAPRTRRPEIPPRLERVVLRCLEKNAADRYQNYDDLSRELELFASSAPEPASLGRRFIAGLIDTFLVGSIVSAPLLALGELGWRLEVMTSLPLFIYGWLTEGHWGATLGKLVTGLRVIGPDRVAPGLRRALTRSALFWLVEILASLLGAAVRSTSDSTIAIASSLFALLLLILFVTARRSNGWMAVHDLLSGTRVVRRRTAVAYQVGAGTATPVPDTVGEETIGPYAIIERFPPRGEANIILGLDRSLRRRVWIVERAIDDPPTPEGRRDLSRRCRLRWLNSHRTATAAWDAYEALDGAPLLDVIRPGVEWQTVRVWLRELAEEACQEIEDDAVEGESRDAAGGDAAGGDAAGGDAAGEDATNRDATRATLSLDHVWIQPDGHAVLLDFPAPGLTAAVASTGVGAEPSAPADTARADTTPADATPADVALVDVALGDVARAGGASAAGDRLRALQHFLHQVMTRALGGSRDGSASESAGASGNPLPLHASHLQSQLESCVFAASEPLLAGLGDCQRRSPILSRRRRLMQLAPLMAAVAFLWLISIGMYAFLTAVAPDSVRAVKRCAREIRRLEQQQLDASTTARIAALEVYIAGPLRAAAEDSIVTIGGQPIDPAGDRNRALIRRSLASHPHPSAVEIAAARRELAGFQSVIEARDTRRRHAGKVMTMLGAILHMAMPIALLLGLMTRGGPMLHLFEIAVVTRDGTRASHPRALLRSLLTWSPFLALWVIAFPMHSYAGWSSPALPYVLAVFLIGVIYAVASPRRGLQDRVARTYLVPR